MNKRWSANIYIAISVVVGYILSLIVSSKAIKMTPFTVNLLNVINVVVITAVPILVFACFNRRDFKTFFSKTCSSEWWKYILVVPVLWSCATYLNLRMNILLENFGLKLIEQLPPSDKASSVIMGFVLTCVAAPILEEIFYRGVILHLLKGYGKGGAIVVSALLFAIAHGSITIFVSPLVFGLVLGYITLHSGSIFPAMFMHFGCNFISWLIMNFGQEQPLSTIISVATIIVGASASIFGIIRLIKNKKLVLNAIVQICDYIKNPLWLPIVANYIFTNIMNHG